MTADPTENILFETSPFGTIDSIVEHDGRVVYFYLNERPGESGQQPGRFGTRACWVRNLLRGPLVMDKAEMAEGNAPLMPRNDCVDIELQNVPPSNTLKVVWFEEGNGAALLETDTNGQQKTIAIIPPWSGIDGFHGYAANCAYETPLAWPMPENKSLQLRIDRATEFWSSFTENDSPFTQLQPNLIETYDNFFGKENQKQYYAIDGGKFPPRGLIRYETASHTVVMTVGMSLCPQPTVELSVEDPSNLKRIEIGTRIPIDAAGPNEDHVTAAMQSISTYAAYPWRNQTWLGPGHTIDWSATGSKATLVKDSALNLANFREDPVSLLWIEAQV